MSTFIHLVFIVSVLVNLKEICGLNDTAHVEDSEILRTKSIIRNTTNKIFTSLKLKGINYNPVIKHYSLIHSYFVSLTLQDHNNLNQIANLSRVDKKIYDNKTYDNRIYDNRTATFIDQVIEILNGDSNASQRNVSEEIVFPVFNYTDYIVNYIDARLKELEYYLQIYNNNGTNSSRLDINKDILAVLNNNAQFLNETNKIEDIFELFENQSVNETGEDDLFANDNDTWMDPRLSGRRIYNGKRTKIKHFPFMASIEIFKKFTCGGSIISEDLIITAASCLQLAWNNRFYRENPSFIHVRVGSNYYGGGGEAIRVLEVFFHPSYNPQTLSNNIAIARLRKQIRFRNRKKSPIKMVSIDRRDSPLPMNVDGITIVGWGAKTIKNMVHSPWDNKISYAVLDVYSLQECQDIYSKEYVKTTNFCAGFISKGTGACNGDVGGAGLVAGLLTGIISFGAATCGTPNSPTVFTKVGYYAKWIDQVYEQVQLAPHNKHETTLKTTPYHPYLTRRKTRIWLTQFTALPLMNIEEAIPVFSDAPPPHETIIVTETPNTNAFKQFIKTMFDSKEIADYLKLDAEDKETNLMNAQIVEQRKEQIEETFPQIHPFTPIDSDTYATPIAKHKRKQKRKRKQKHDKVPVTALDYYRHKTTTTESYNYKLDEVPSYMDFVNTALGLASAEKTTKKIKRITKNFEEYDDFYTERTSKHETRDYDDFYTKKTKKQETQEYESDYTEPTKKLNKQRTTRLTAKMWPTSKQTTKKTTKMTQSEEEKKLLDDIQKLTYNVNDDEYIDYDIESTQEKMEDKSAQVPIQEPAQGSFQIPARGSAQEVFQEQVQVPFHRPTQVPFLQSVQVPVSLQLPAQVPLQNPAQVFNENNYEDDEGGMSIYMPEKENKGLDVFNNKEIIDTKELEIDMVAGKGQEKAEQAIDDMLKDYILGSKFNDDEAKNQAAEELDDYDGIPIGDDVQFDLDDVVSDKEEEYPMDFTGGLPIS